MAFDNAVHTIPGLTAEASGSMAADQHLFVKMKGASYPLQITLAAEGESAIGVLQNKPTAGAAATVAGIGSVSKVKVGSGGLDAGDLVASDASGKGVTADADDAVLGIALDTTTTDGELATVYLTGIGAKAVGE